MISDEDVKRLFKNGERILTEAMKHLDRSKPLPTQFHRGVGLHTWEDQHPGGCQRHLSVFNKFNIIPKYCFNCYKVLFEPRTVVELFKLMVVFEQLELPKDNTRKCIVETRPQIPGAYKAFIYCRGIEEGREILKMVRKVVLMEISRNIPATVKRGCSEYPLAYPEYAQIGQGKTAMSYKEEWQEYEDLADINLVVNTQLSASDTHNRPGYTGQDALIMLAWLKYAATIGDLSYLKISDGVLKPFLNMIRPSPFRPLQDE